jgi:hypothetical protein
MEVIKSSSNKKLSYDMSHVSPTKQTLLCWVGLDTYINYYVLCFYICLMNCLLHCFVVKKHRYPFLCRYVRSLLFMCQKVNNINLPREVSTASTTHKCRWLEAFEGYLRNYDSYNFKILKF